MQQKHALLPTLQRLVPELAIKKLVHITTQHSFKATYDSRGFRLDIFAEDQNGRRLDLEMQVINHHDLLKRAACYQAMMIDEQLEEGDFYQRLWPVYVIFITMFDPFGGTTRSITTGCAPSTPTSSACVPGQLPLSQRRQR